MEPHAVHAFLFLISQMPRYHDGGNIYDEQMKGDDPMRMPAFVAEATLHGRRNPRPGLNAVPSVPKIELEASRSSTPSNRVSPQFIRPYWCSGCGPGTPFQVCCWVAPIFTPAKCWTQRCS